MGASESTEIHVNFNRENLFYYGGEQVAGTIAFHNSHEKLNVDQIFLEFIGELGYTSQETRRHHEANGRTRTEHYTEYHRVPFMTHRFPVVQPQHGQVNDRFFPRILIYMSLSLARSHSVSWSTFLAIRIRSSPMFTSIVCSIHICLSLCEILRSNRSRQALV